MPDITGDERFDPVSGGYPPVAGCLRSSKMTKDSDQRRQGMDKRMIVPAAVALAMLMIGGCAQQAEMAAADSGTQWVYTVKQGDADLRTVAEKVYGNEDPWRILAEANPDVNAGKLEPGQELMIPELTDPQGQPIAPKGCDRRRTY